MLKNWRIFISFFNTSL